MSKTSKKYYRVTILMFLVISLLIPPVMVSAYDGPVYTVKKAQAALGTKITGDWMNESIDKVLHDLAKMAKVNIFTSPQVTGNITAELMDVPLEEALTNILTALGYTFVATDNMIRVVPMHEITLAKEELVSKVYRIMYADANEVGTSLREFVSNAGSVGVDRGTSHIVVTDTEYKIRGVDKFIAELNRPRQQVLVEVKIYDITTYEGFNLGAALYAANIPLKETGLNGLGRPPAITQPVTPGYTVTSEDMLGYEDKTTTGTGGYSFEETNYEESTSGTESIKEMVPTVVETETLYEEIPLNYSSSRYYRPTGSKPFVGGSFDRTRGGTLSFSLLNDAIDLEFALNMLKKQVEYKVLANPRILVLDNETARFEIAREIPYRELLQVSREDPMTYTAFKNVGVQLEVTPQIAEDGMIKLHIVPEFGTLVSQNAVSVLTRKDDYGRDVYQNVLGAPIVDVRRTDTVALLKTGQSVAIGGMRKRETSKDISKVPLLGDIPLLGNLFRSNTESVSISELVVLITPRIISNSEPVPPELSADGENGIPKRFGVVYQRQQDYRRVTESSDKVSRNAENTPGIAGMDPALILKVAYAHLKMGRFQLAKEMLESLIEREPENGRAHQYLGYCNLKLGDVNGAIDNYVTAVDLNDADWEAHRGLGVAYMVKARSDGDSVLAGKAVEQWRTSLNIKPDQAKGWALAKMIETYSQ
jgi:type IV pilus assembly protein PilQ